MKTPFPEHARLINGNSNSRRERVSARILVLPDPLTTGNAKHIARFAAEAHLATMFGLRAAWMPGD